MQRFLHLALALGFGGALSACGPLVVHATNPAPNVSLAPKTVPVAFRMGPGIHNEFTVPEGNGIKETRVEGWQTTLQSGWDTGLSSLFVQDPGKPGYTVELVQTDLSWAPNTLHHVVSSVNAQLRYKAQLRDPAGNVQKVSAKMVTSAFAATRVDAIDQAAKSAVEAMYESIALDLLQDLGAS